MDSSRIEKRISASEIWPGKWEIYRHTSKLTNNYAIVNDYPLVFWSDDMGNAYGRPYLSWSQSETWRKGDKNGHAEYFRRYFQGQQLPTTPQMLLGAKIAKALAEIEKPIEQVCEEQGWNSTEQEMQMLQHYRHFLPRYAHREVEIQQKFRNVPLLAKPDGFDLYGTDKKIVRIVLGEDKSGRLWNQERADTHKQIDLYDIVFWQKYGVIPENTLHWIPTYKDGAGEYRPTGEIFDYPTPRTEAQLIESGGEFIRIWHEIGEEYGAECRANGLI